MNHCPEGKGGKSANEIKGKLLCRGINSRSKELSNLHRAYNL